MRFLAASVTLICCPLVAFAHHASGVGYDRSNITEVEGEITAVIWRNPHVRVDLTRIGPEKDPFSDGGQ